MSERIAQETRLLTLESAAQDIGLKPAELRTAIRNGLLTHVRVGRRYSREPSALTRTNA